jgi:hypothetical protein
LKAIGLSSFLCEKGFFEDILAKPSCLSVAERRLDCWWLLSVSSFCAMFTRTRGSSHLNVIDFGIFKQNHFLWRLNAVVLRHKFPLWKIQGGFSQLIEV